MNIYTIVIGIFLISLLIIELVFHAYTSLRYPERGLLRKRLRTLSFGDDTESPDLVKTRSMSDVPFLNTLLQHAPGARKLDRLVQQANAGNSVGFFLLLSGVLAFYSFLATYLLTRNYAFCVIIAALLVAAPFLFLSVKKQKRALEFEKQLPDALDLIARALKAGHAFTNGMKLAADEFNDPLGPEFQETLDQINFGVSVSDALKNLTARVDCPDLKFFVVSVILQRETGGNLAEIIGGIAHLIRKRFRFQDRVRVLAAEGKLSGVILCALPFLVVTVIFIRTPQYMSLLFSEHMGRVMIVFALSLMAMGIIVIKKMVTIKV